MLSSKIFHFFVYKLLFLITLEYDWFYNRLKKINFTTVRLTYEWKGHPLPFTFEWKGNSLPLAAAERKRRPVPLPSDWKGTPVHASSSAFCKGAPVSLSAKRGCGLWHHHHRYDNPGTERRAVDRAVPRKADLQSALHTPQAGGPQRPYDSVQGGTAATLQGRATDALKTGTHIF